MDILFQHYGRHLKKGEILFQEGDTADYLYMIQSGKIQITKKIGNKDEIIQTLKEGEFIGEMAVINSALRSATAMAIEDCRLISMDRESFNNSVKDNHAFAISVIEMLSARLRETDELISGLVTEKRTQTMLNEIITEFIRTGKRDKAGKWSLIPFEPFLEKIRKKYPYSNDLVLSSLSELHKDRVELKTGQDSKKYLAFNIGDPSS